MWDEGIWLPSGGLSLSGTNLYRRQVQVGAIALTGKLAFGPADLVGRGGVWFRGVAVVI